LQIIATSGVFKLTIMKKRYNSIVKRFRAAIFLTMTGLLISQVITAQGWYSASWQNRTPITISNPGTTPLTDFQVQVILNLDNFDFAVPLSNGSDVRVTSDDGITLIPFWIELWDQPNDTASLWVKVPVIPVDSTVIYIYYGNSSPTMPPPVETPPVGPYTRAVSNPIAPIGDPGAGASLLAENIVWDPVSGHYWMVFANYRSGSWGVGLVWSDDPTNAASWNWHGNIYTHTGGGSFAPHLLYEGGLWYVFFASLPNIVYITCSTINGTYSAPTVVLSPSETWETYRVDEPYVFKRNSTNKWVLVYMGDAGSITEQIGYATADNLTGPYTKYSGNPCITFGPSGSYDAGTVADPWVYEYYGVYYIGYTVSPTKSSPWSTACATTTDWISFTKLGIIFPVASSGWDSNNSFRGAVTKINEDYVFSYTGGAYRLGIATQPVYRLSSELINNPESVFDFYDGFGTGTDPDLTKWTFASGNPGTHTNIAGGLLTMAATTTYVRIDGLTYFGTGYVGETYARHPNQGTNLMIMEAGFVQGAFSNTLRIADDFHQIPNWERQSKTSTTTGDPWVTMAQAANQNWHTFRIYRNSSGTAGFQIDGTTIETFETDVPIVGMAPFLMSYGNTNQFIVDWTRIRKWAGEDPKVSVGTEWTGASSNDWASSGNWISGFSPFVSNDVIIPSVSSYPIISGTAACNKIIMEPLARMTVESTGTLTVSGAITINTSSTLASGSLLNLGTVNGNVIYNRYLLPKASGGDFQVAASPVVGNTNDNALDIQRVKSWDEVSGLWTTGSMLNLPSGRGYNLKQTETGDRIIAFRGSLVAGDVEINASSPFINVYDGTPTQYVTRTYVADAASHSGKARDNDLNWGGGGWNLLGNPFTSSMSVAGFIGENYSATHADSQFDPSYVALYINDGASNSFRYVSLSTGWEGGTYLNEDNLQAGQGFFVLAMNDLSKFTFTRSMQVHDVDVPMLKSAKVDDRWPGVQLKVKFAAGESSTLVVYNENMTAGLDPGYDIGQYSNYPDVEVYTTIAGQDNSINFARQALPLADYNKNIIPVGIDTEKGGEVTFSASTVPIGSYKFWLEDKLTGIYTDLTAKSYTVTIPANTYGTGRFFIIASTNTPTGIALPDAEDSGVRIWTSNEKIIIRGDVSEGAICEIHDLRGGKILERRLADGELNTVDIPSGLNGVFIVRVIDGMKVTTRKVAIL
jgi:hypothetical protein